MKFSPLNHEKKNSFFPNTEYITQNTQTGDNVKVFCPMFPDIREK